MFGFHKKKSDASQNAQNTNTNNMAGQATSEKIISDEFMRYYAPYMLPDFKYEPRPESEMPQFDDIRLGILAYQVELRRKEDIHAGPTLAGREIYANLLEMLKTEKGVHVESLLAVIGSAGGYECMNGIMTALNAVLSGGYPLSAAGALSIYIVENKNGEKNLFGDRAGIEFSSFYMTAAKIPASPWDKLKPLSEKAAQTCGTPEYWQTPFDDKVGKSPRELSEMFRGKFETTFKVFCRYPQERMLAWAVAARLAVEQASSVIAPDGKETALSILAEYGWRTSHFIG